MQIIIVTSPDCKAGEARIIEEMLQQGVDYAHLRKPKYTAGQMRELIASISARWHDRLVLHDHFELTKEFQIGGLHLNGRHPTPCPGFKGRLSRSCHSLQEVEEHKDGMRYVFLSPIFDSISKQGYQSVFSIEELREACRRGIIDSRVVALGGVTPIAFKQLHALGFGGAALLGDVWHRPADTIMAHVNDILRAAKNLSLQN